MNEQSQPSYEFGPFSLNAGKRLLLRNGEPVPLAPKVLETLLALIENRERVVTKDELLKQVWGDTIVEEGGLTRNVSVLRKILGEKPDDHQYIVTVPARGYRFVADVRERWPDDESSGAHVPAPPARDGPERGLSARRWLVLGGLAAIGVATLAYVLRPVRATEPGQTAVTSAPGQAHLGTLPLVNPAAYDSGTARAVSQCPDDRRRYQSCDRAARTRRGTRSRFRACVRRPGRGLRHATDLRHARGDRGSGAEGVRGC